MNKHVPCCAAIAVHEQVAALTDAKQAWVLGSVPPINVWLRELP